MTDHEVVAHDAWVAARSALLTKEKELTRLRDELSRQRRELPWEAVAKEYAFEAEAGEQTLADLFAGRSQLVVYHFMFEPEAEVGCPHCSFWADNFDGWTSISPTATDVTFVAISRAPLARIARVPGADGVELRLGLERRGRLQLRLRRLVPAEQLEESVFNYAPACQAWRTARASSVFFKDESGDVFHTYSTYGRGIDMLNAAYHYLDLVPKGRGEEGRQNQYWLRRRDEY